MSIFHPGDRTLTDLAVSLAGWKSGDKVLDLGCGDGDTMVYLQEKYSLETSGCDIDKNMVALAKKRDPSLRVTHTEGIELDYPSLYFDGALMECSFSLMHRHDELLHELYCVLKPGARMAIADLYCINPDFMRAERAYIGAKAILNRPRQDKDCEGSQQYPSPYILDGAFLQDKLIKAVREVGFELTAFKDKTPELRDFYAQALMDYGSLDAFWAAALPEGSAACNFCRVKPSKDLGYFLMVLEKKV